MTTMNAKKPSDPTLMTINGKKVPLSEFQYLYNKNNTQQAAKQSIDDYADMFVAYKLKVADAEAAGIDTTAAFQKEFAGYRTELARPYLRDTTVLNKLINEAYGRMKEEVDVSHIMLHRGENPESDARQATKLDSLRTAILNGADFAQLALEYSIDPGVKRNMGHMGYITANQYPYSFEMTAYNTPVGEISQVIQTDFGHHIVKVNARRPARGEVLVQHILKLTQGMNAEQAKKQKAAIDSIYTLLKQGADFDQLARTESEDPGSARNAGKLPWFGSGRMVPEFESTSFALADGEISEPFSTAYGYHIVKKLEHRDIKSFDEAKEGIIAAMGYDERNNMPEKAKLEQLKAQYKSTINAKTLEMVLAAVNANGQLDSTVVDKFRGSKAEAFKVGKTSTPLSQVITKIPVYTPVKADGAKNIVTHTFDKALDDATLEAEREVLADKYPEYRNLINEYRDGMLLFEVSNTNVWDKAAKDKQGLETYFNANRDKYTWDKPHYKGYIIFTPSDSLETTVRSYIATELIPVDSISSVMKAQFGRDVKVERVIAAKGDNAIVDAVAFGGEKPESNARWTNYFQYAGQVIDQPQEAADVLGAVTTDYQTLLEKQWIDQLKAKYPVTIDKKLLDSLK